MVNDGRAMLDFIPIFFRVNDGRAMPDFIPNLGMVNDGRAMLDLIRPHFCFGKSSGYA
jgi:hypothetical protein